MRLVFLGTGGYHPNERRHTAGVMLPDAGLVLDAGSCSFRVKDRVSTGELDVFLSHAHLDHIWGLTFFIVPLIEGVIKRMRIHARPEFLEAIDKHLFDTALFPVPLPNVDFVELQAETTLVDGGRVTHCPLEHPGGSTGFRIDWPDRSLAYITDTVAPGDYIDFIRGVDLLIHECYFPDELAEWAAHTGHSHTTAVAKLAAEAEVGRLMLVHIDPTHEEDDPIDIEVARNIFPATEIAEDLQEVDF